MRRALLAIMMSAMTMAAAGKIQVHGHRGARAAMPENSLPAFEYAIAQGADVLELDLAVTQDNVLVVSHDPEMSKVFCQAPTPELAAQRVIRQMPLKQLKQWDCGALGNPEFPKQSKIPGTRVPTLDEVFTATKGSRVEYNIETKIFKNKPELTPSPEEFSKLVLAVVKKHNLEARVILQSFDDRTLIAMKPLSSKIRLSMLTPTSMADAAKNWVETTQAAGASIASPHFRTVTKERVEQAHRAGLTVVPWTANEPAQWQALVDAGSDAIISDDPAALIAWLKSKGLR
jgi:glycerophosphoryl diester phosphodiesterase